MDTAVAQPPPGRAARSRLKDFYGIAEATGATAATDSMTATSGSTTAAVDDVDATKRQGRRASGDRPAPPRTNANSEENPLNLNSRAFQCDRFVGQLVHERSLRSLLEVQCALLEEIQTIDSDMKTLVYENYEKFISATDTIKTMSLNVESMETEMTKLGEQITKISEQSTRLSRGFAEKRAQIADYGGRHNLLKKLQFIFELPSRLRECLAQTEHRHHADAVRYHFRTQALFEHYRDVAVFKSLETECVQIVGQIAERVRARFRAGDATKVEIKELASCVRSLLALGESPRVISKEYIKFASARFQAKKQAALGFQPSTQIADAAAKVPSLTTLSPRKLARSPINESVAMDMDFIGATTAETNPALALTHAGTRPTSVAMSSTSALAATTSSATSLSQQDLLVERARLLNTTFLQDVCFFVDSFHHIFLSEKHRKTLKANKVGLTEDGRSFVVYLVPEDFKEVKKDMDEFTRSLINDFFATIEGLLTAKDTSKPISAETHVLILDMLFRDLNAAGERSSIVQTAFSSKAVSLIGVFLNRIIHEHFATLRMCVIKELLALNDPQPKPDVPSSVDPSVVASTPEVSPTMGTFVDSLDKRIRGPLLDSCMDALKKLHGSGATFMETLGQSFQDAVRFELKSFWVALLDEMTKLSKTLQFRIEPASQQQTHSRTILLLVMSRLATGFASSTVSDVFRKVLGALGCDGDSSTRGNTLVAVTGAMGDYGMEVDEVHRKCRQVSQAILLRFVECAANEISVMVRKSMESRNWMLMKEPKRVSKLWEQVVEDLDLLDRDIVSLFGKPAEVKAAALADRDDKGSLHQSDTSAAAKQPSLSYSAHNSNAPSQLSMFAASNRSSLLGRAASIANYSASATSNFMSRMGGAIQQNFMNNLDRLFTEKLEIYPRSIVESRVALHVAIIKITLKTFIEITRLRTLSKSGYQQLQVDVEFARVQLWRLVASEEKLVNSMLDEVMAAAGARCTEPSASMESSVVEKILSHDKAVVE